MNAKHRGDRSKQRSNLNSSDAIASDPLRVDRALRNYLHRLSGTSSDEEIGKELSVLGALFGMPHVLVHPAPMQSEISADGKALQAPGAWPRRLLSRKRTRARAAVEFEIRSKEGRICRVTFSGRRPTANGLARSLLLFASSAAAQARDGSSQRPAPSIRSLTSREQQVLDRAKNGRTDAEIAGEMGIAMRTVRFHLANAMGRLGIANRAKLIAHAARQGGVEQ